MMQNKETFPLVYDPEIISVVQLTQSIQLPSHSQYLISQTITEDEISLVAPAKYIAQHQAIIKSNETDWQTLKIDQILEFNMVGILAKIGDILATADISIFVISTFNTDYILIKKRDMANAIHILREKGFPISNSQ